MSQQASPSVPDPARRTLLRGAAVGGMVAPFLVACGSDETTTPSPSADEGPPDGGEPTKPGETEEPGGSAPLAATSDVPVGGGVVLTDDKIVLTQPTDGEIKAFTAVCTHQACVVASVSDGKITCGCHDSQYAIEDGTVVRGPATGDLKPVEISVQGDSILRG